MKMGPRVNYVVIFSSTIFSTGKTTQYLAIAALLINQGVHFPHSLRLDEIFSRLNGKRKHSTTWPHYQCAASQQNAIPKPTRTNWISSHSPTVISPHSASQKSRKSIYLLYTFESTDEPYSTTNTKSRTHEQAPKMGPNEANEKQVTEDGRRRYTRRLASRKRNAKETSKWLMGQAENLVISHKSSPIRLAKSGQLAWILVDRQPRVVPKENRGKHEKRKRLRRS